MYHITVVSLLPELIKPVSKVGVLGRACDEGLFSLEFISPRDFAKDTHRTVDDRPYGGGPGMVIKVEPVVECVEAVRANLPVAGRLILLTPQGRRLTQPLVEELASEASLQLLCGRYEGFDQRVTEILQPDEISIGDYILGGGEVAAMVLIDAVARLVPGVLGDERSSVEDSFSQGNRLLEFAQYTRPREYRGHTVPEVLLNGNHDAILKWRQEQTLQRTRERRADLLDPGDDRPI